MSKLKPNQFILDGHTITEIPLLFQTAMVQAVMEGRKNQTRRTRGLESINTEPDRYILGDIEKLKHDWLFYFEDTDEGIDNLTYDCVKSPYGKPGDLLWVRETWGHFSALGSEMPIVYKADKTFDTPAKEHLVGHQWKPSIHMPKAACRIWLMVEEIRVERLQDISGDDIFSEGVVVPMSENNTIVFTLGKKNNAINFLPDGFAAEGQPKLTGKQILFAHWAELWCEVNGRDSWDANPWVWVVKFRVLSKTGRPSDKVISKNWKEVTHA